MKLFDSASIRARIEQKLIENPNWKISLAHSAIDSILSEVSESLAEQARYSEYLYNESKWDTAQNLSSILSAAGQLGYKSARKKSAFGEIYVSVDPRVTSVGKTIYKDDFTDLNNDLVDPWKSAPVNIHLDENVSVRDSSGNEYIIVSTTEDLTQNNRYIRASIIEGRRKRISLPIETIRNISKKSLLDQYIYVPIKIINCEDASSAYTSKLLRVEIETTQGSTTEFRIVESLHFSEPTDQDVEIIQDLYNKDLMYLKFNTTSTRGAVLDISMSSSVNFINVYYIESNGESGNMTKTYESFRISNLDRANSVNNGFDYSSATIYGVNFEPIIGGTDEETVSQVKENAPSSYVKNYSIGIAEAYEKLIKKINFGTSEAVYPTKAKVYPGRFFDVDTNAYLNVVYFSMICPAIEQYARDSEKLGQLYDYSIVENVVNYYLSKLKSPTDVLKYSPPEYVRLAIGITTSIKRGEINSLSLAKSNISSAIKDSYSSQATDSLDFGRSIYEADIISVIKADPAYASVKVEMEAVSKLDWRSSIRMQPNPQSVIHTIRIPFSFNSIFTGNTYIKGFRDYKTGASYVLRFDLFYKHAESVSADDYHSSLFIKEDLVRTNDKFYLLNDNGKTPIYDKNAAVATDYPFDDTETSELTRAYQYYLKPQVYDDDSFESLIANTAKEPQINDPYKDLGCLDTFLVYYTGDTNGDIDGTIGEGYFEFEVSAVYFVLQKFASLGDTALDTLLKKYPLSNIRCDNSLNAFNGFVSEVLSKYVEIYVSARLNDKDIIPNESESQQNTILYIDIDDSSSSNDLALKSIATLKESRFISVDAMVE